MATKSSDASVASKMEVQISYCSELGIYHYVRTDGDEFFFDNDKLEQSCQRLTSIFLAEECRRHRCASLAERLLNDGRGYGGSKPPGSN